MTEKNKKLMAKIALVLFVLIILFVVFANKLNIPLRTYLLAILPASCDNCEGGGNYQDQGPPPLASCFLVANPTIGTGPFNSQITATFSNLPVGTNQALIKCDLNDAGVNVVIQNNVTTRTCSYPQVTTQTFFRARASADVAVCTFDVSNNPDTTPPTITTNPSHLDISQTSARIEWVTNETSDSKVRYGTTSGQYPSQSYEATLTQNHSITLSGLQAQTTYYYVAVSVDSAGNSTTSIEQNFTTAAPSTPPSSSGGSGSGNESVNAPTDPSVIINEGAENTATTTVTLILSVTANGPQMAILNSENFEDANWENFIPIKTWTLTPGSGIKTVYVKFRDNNYNTSEIVSDSIVLIELIEPTSTEPIATSTPPTSTSTIVFTRNLYFGIKGNDVKTLQQFLNNSNFKLAESSFGSPGNETDFFGVLTKAALIKFQEANIKEILTPLNLTKGTGYFGPATRNFVNSLILGNFSGGK